IVAVDPGSGEGVGEQRRRHRALDIRADQPDQHPALAHDAGSGWLRPSPRTRCAMGGSDRARVRQSIMALDLLNSIRSTLARPGLSRGAPNMSRSAAGTFACVVAIAAPALIGMPPAAEAQTFPVKPVRIIVPFTPGSPNDVMARLLAQHLQARLGQA